MKIKVLVIDDSALIRNILKEIINEQSDMTVVGSAPDPLVAREMIRSLNPDVLTLDIEMPNMNGLSFLKRLMRVRPMPVVMLSSHTQEGSDIAFRALAMGAVDFVGKPVAGETTDDDYTQLIVEKIRGAYAARDKIEPLDINRATGDADEVLPMLGNTSVAQSRVIVIGASTGGAEALKDILITMPEDCPPILIAQHMPGGIGIAPAARDGWMDAGPDWHGEPAQHPLHGRDRRLLSAGVESAVEAAPADAAETGARLRRRQGCRWYRRRRPCGAARRGRRAAPPGRRSTRDRGSD